MEWDVRTDDGHRALGTGVSVADRQRHGRPRLTTDPASDLVDRVPVRRLAVCGKDHVVDGERCLLGRAALEYLDDARQVRRIEVDADADPDERATQGVVALLALLGR